MNRQRIDRLMSEASRSGFDAVLLSSPVNIRYFSGFVGEGTAVVSPKLLLIVTDSRYTEQAAAQAAGFRVADIARETHAAVALRYLKEAGVKAAGFEDEVMTVAARRRYAGAGIAFRGIGSLCGRIRAVKDPGEIEAIRRAARLTDEGFAHILAYIKPGTAEYELQAEMDYFFARSGAAPAFPMIAASGPNGSMPHAGITERRIRRGDLVTLDFGARIDGYCADMTRTVALGEPDQELRAVYAAVLEAQRAAESAARAGITGRELDAVARSVIERAGHGSLFGHGLGHGVGLEVHEQPSVSMKNGDEALEPGMVVTIEPGIYLPGKGGVRIENTCLMRSCDCEPLFAAVKELLIL